MRRRWHLFSPIALILISALFMVTSISEIHTDRAFASRGKSAVVDPPPQYKEIIHSKNGQPTSREEKANISFSAEDGRSVTLADRYPAHQRYYDSSRTAKR